MTPRFLRVRFPVLCSSLAALGIACASLAGCVTEQRSAEPYAKAAVNQKYAMDEVRDRLDQLEPGMSKPAVLMQLGSPAIQRETYWEYRPERSGTVLPAAAVRVHFENDRYTGHEDVPIVLGEDVD
ncbi:MAG: hypothetical protein ACOC1G_07900 [Phycisphaeraceae bacterium]